MPLSARMISKKEKNTTVHVPFANKLPEGNWARLQLFHAPESKTTGIVQMSRYIINGTNPALIEDADDMFRFYNDSVSVKRRISIKLRKQLADAFDLPHNYSGPEAVKLEKLLQQLSDTCHVYRDLAHEKYPPSFYKINDMNFVSRINEKDINNINGFINNNNKSFNQGLTTRFRYIIRQHLASDPYYKDSGQPEFTERQFIRNGSNIQVPDNEKDTYCIYRTMHLGSLPILANYWKVKDQIETAIGDNIPQFVRRIGKSTETEKDKIAIATVKQLATVTPLTGHLGNVGQASTYGGILVKFHLKSGLNKDFVNQYLVKSNEEHVTSGGQGPTTDNLIGVKSENIPKASIYKFSFNLGNAQWPAILFLSAIEKYETYDLGKNEGSVTSELTDSPPKLR